MSDDIDAFLASLDAFSSPSIEAGISHVRQLQQQQQQQQREHQQPLASHSRQHRGGPHRHNARHGSSTSTGSAATATTTTTATTTASVSVTEDAARSTTVPSGHHQKRQREDSSIVITRTAGAASTTQQRLQPPSLSSLASSSVVHGEVPSTAIPPLQSPVVSSSADSHSTEGRHQHHRHRHHHQRPRPDAPTSTAGLYASSSATSPVEAATAAPLGWQCARCTLVNETASPTCAACDAPRPQLPAHLLVGSTPVTQKSCPRCTYLNAVAQKQCEMCGAVLPSLEATNAGAGAVPFASRVSTGASEPAATAVHSTTLPTLAGNGEPITVDGPTSAHATISAAVNHAPVAQPQEEVLSSPSDAESDSVTSSSDEYDDDEDEEEDSAASSSDDEAVTSDSADSTEHEEASAMDNRQLVRFLQTLESVPFDQLPYAAVPSTMQEHAQLRPFQLQALHWLLAQERGGGMSSTSGGGWSGNGSGPSSRQGFHSVGGGSASTEGGGGRYGQASPSGPHASVSSGGAADAYGVKGPSTRCTNTANGMADSFYASSSSGDVTARAMRTVRGGIYADYMGLGKTRTLIALCEATRGPRYDRVTGSQVISPATLIVCPTSLLSQWVEEIKQCVRPVPRILLYYGSRKKRLSLFEVAQQYDYVLTSYQVLRHESPLLASTPGKMYMIHWQRVILDEAHYIRNIRTQQSRACLKLSSTFKWAVTATPVQNSVNDLYPLLRFLQVPHFSVLEWWNEEIVRYFNEDPNHPRPVTALRLLFSSLLLRRTPESMVNGQPVLQLPAKSVRSQLVVLSREERAFYDAVHRKATHKLDAAGQSRTRLATFTTAFEMLVRCRQTCLHPYIVVAALRRYQGQSMSGVAAATAESPSAHPAPSAAAEADREEARLAELQRAIHHFVDTVVMKRLKVRGGGGEFLKELVDALRQQKLEERECIICLDSLHRPAILPCAHTFCAECIQHALQMNRVCPLCKRTTRPSDVLLVPEELTGTSTSSAEAGAGAGTTGNESEAAAVPNVDNVDVSDLNNWPLTLSAKTSFLVDAIRRTPSEEKVVVFSSFVTYLRYAKHCLEGAGIPCEMVTGALTLRQKAAALRRFRGESDGQASATKEKSTSLTESEMHTDSTTTTAAAITAFPSSASSPPTSLGSLFPFGVGRVAAGPAVSTGLSFSSATAPTSLWSTLSHTVKDTVQAFTAGGATSPPSSSSFTEGPQALSLCAEPEPFNTTTTMTAFPKAPRVLLATTTSCGVGLNLTCANHCFLMEPTWNPGVEEQALNRIHRIGQARPVQVVKLIAQGTVEEKIEQLCQRKRMLSGYCFTGARGEAGGGGSTRLRTEDLLALFAPPSTSSESSSSDDDEET